MAYTVPSGNAVDIKFLLESYVAPAGDDVELSFSEGGSAAGQITFSGEAIGGIGVDSAATGQLAFSVSAAGGHNPSIWYSSQAIPLPLVVSAEGEAKPAALANDQVRLSGSGDGASAHVGSATGRLTDIFGGATEGVVRTSGVAAGTAFVSGVGYGLYSGVFDSAYGQYRVSGSASGSAMEPVYADASGSYSASGAGEIIIGMLAYGSGAVRLSASGSSAVGRTSAAIGKLPLSVSATAFGRGIGAVAAGAVSVVASGHGVRGNSCSATISMVFSGVSVALHTKPVEASATGYVLLGSRSYGDFILHPEGIPENTVFVLDRRPQLVVTSHV